MVRHWSVLALTLALSGCGALPFEMLESPEQRPFAATLGVSIPPSQSMGALPANAGSVVSVLERRRGNALQHEVTLHGAPPNYGENQLIITAFRNVSSPAEKPIEDMLTNTRPTEAEIDAEMQERIPGGALPLSNATPANAIGTFGYAFGRRNGVSCIYAWQWLDKEQMRTTAPVSVRARICRPGMTEEVMVDFMRQLWLNPRNGDSNAVMARGGYAPGRMGNDALSAARGGGYAPPGYSAQNYGAPSPYASAGYGGGYGGGYAQQAPARERVAAAPVRRKVIRRIVRRRVVAPQIYSYAPPPAAAPAYSAPAPAAGGYSAVPMPQ